MNIHLKTRKTACSILILLSLGVMPLLQAGMTVSEDDPESEADNTQEMMMGEILAALESKQAAVAEIQARFEAALDEASALQLQREVEALKVAAEVEILGIQLRYARQEDRHEAAAALEAAIKTITEPRPRLEASEESKRRDPSRTPETGGR